MVGAIIGSTEKLRLVTTLLRAPLFLLTMVAVFRFGASLPGRALGEDCVSIPTNVGAVRMCLRCAGDGLVRACSSLKVRRLSPIT